MDFVKHIITISTTLGNNNNHGTTNELIETIISFVVFAIAGSVMVIPKRMKYHHNQRILQSKISFSTSSTCSTELHSNRFVDYVPPPPLEVDTTIDDADDDNDDDDVVLENQYSNITSDHDDGDDRDQKLLHDEHNVDHYDDSNDIDNEDSNNVSNYDVCDNGMMMYPIGMIQSVYKLCVGTPRQGLLVSNSRGRIVLHNLSYQASRDAVDGLQQFSHIWILFIFHLNNNNTNHRKKEKRKTKNEATNGMNHQPSSSQNNLHHHDEDRGVLDGNNDNNDDDDGNNNTFSVKNNHHGTPKRKNGINARKNNHMERNHDRHTTATSTTTGSNKKRYPNYFDHVPSKIAPPALGGITKMGLLATRSPHRYNPIGISLVQLDHIRIMEMKQNNINKQNMKQTSSNTSNPITLIPCSSSSSANSNNKKKYVVVLEISGLDLVDGTPVIDIKPYVPTYDSPIPFLSSSSHPKGTMDDTSWENQRSTTGVDHNSMDTYCRVPEWVADGLQMKRAVIIIDVAKQQLHDILQANPKALEFYQYDNNHNPQRNNAHCIHNDNDNDYSQTNGVNENPYHPVDSSSNNGIDNTMDPKHQPKQTNHHHVTYDECYETIIQCIEQLFAIDVRSTYQTKKLRQGKFQVERSQQFQRYYHNNNNNNDNDKYTNGTNNDTYGEKAMQTDTLTHVNGDSDITLAPNDDNEHDNSPTTVRNNRMLCTQQFDNLLVHYSIKTRSWTENGDTSHNDSENNESNKNSCSMTWKRIESNGSGAEDTVIIHSIMLI